MKKRSLILSTALLLVAIMACTSATYAWFSQSKEASVSEITASVDAQSSVLISGELGTLVESTYVAPAANTDAWKSALVAADIKSLTAGEKVLTDNSSVNGIDFFKRTSETVPYTFGATTLGNEANGIMEFSIWALSTADGVFNLDTASFSSAMGAAKAARVAIIADGVTTIWEPDSVALATSAGSAYKSTDVDAISAADGTETAQTVDAKDAAINGTKIADLTANTAEKIVFRVWLEGQDAECTNAITGINDIVMGMNFGFVVA